MYFSFYLSIYSKVTAKKNAYNLKAHRELIKLFIVYIPIYNLGK